MTWSVEGYFDLIVNDKASFVAPVNFHCRCCCGASVTLSYQPTLFFYHKEPPGYKPTPLFYHKRPISLKPPYIFIKNVVSTEFMDGAFLIEVTPNFVCHMPDVGLY